MSKGHLFRGAILIIVGALLLLANMGFINPLFWWHVVQLWPVILIALGIRLLAKDSSVGNLLALIMIVSALGYAGWVSQTTGPMELENFVRSEVMQDRVSQGKLIVNFGDGTIRFSGDTEYFTQGKLDYYTNEPQWKYNQMDSSAELEISSENHKGIRFGWLPFNNATRTWDISLNQKPEWDITLNSGACSADIDLSQNNVKDFTLNTGASDIKVKFGLQQDTSNVKIRAGASNIEIFIPKDTGIRLSMSGALSSNNFEEIGLVKSGDVYTSAGYSEKSQRIEIDISAGVSNIKIIWY
jgi:hypothetical protein